MLESPQLITDLPSIEFPVLIGLDTVALYDAMARSAIDGSRTAPSKPSNEDATTGKPLSADENAKPQLKEKKKNRESYGSAGDGEMKKKKRRHDEREANDESSQKKKKAKKRVSFGPDTKQKDGSGSSEHDNDAGDEAEADNSNASAVAPTSEDKENEKAIEAMKKRKREKKKERKNGATPQVHETPILSYLSWYHRDRASWKFQKNRETNIFKHLYSLEHVPASYNVALLVYLQGLKGEASKMRLSQGAAELMSVDKEAEADEDYEQAVDGFRELLTTSSEDIGGSDSAAQFEGEVQKRLQKRQRAELVFYSVTGKLYIGQKPMPAQKQEPAPKKKRKNRTVIVDISSSSESETDSDEEKASSKKKKASARSKKANNSDDSTSSSGSDSSDSDSDSDNSPAPKNSENSKPVSSVPAPSKNKKKQKRKLRTAQVEISSSESESD